MFIRAICILIFLLLAACRGSEKSATETVEKPNVILIVLDGSRADRFSCYGYERATTPRIDAIARSGAIFLNHFANANTTYISIPALFSSSYRPGVLFQVGHHDIFWQTRQEDPKTIFREQHPDSILLPELLTSAGWKTAIFHNVPWVPSYNGLTKHFSEIFEFPISTINETRDEDMISTLINWIEENKNQPLFVYFHVMSPHPPFSIKEEDKEFLGEAVDSELVELTRRRGAHGSAQDWSEEDLEILQSLYESNLKHSDKWIGILVDHLTRLGLKQNTILVITSDHGEALGEQGHLSHGKNLDAVYRVPLIISYPPRIPENTRISGLTESVDIAPTILEMTEIKAPEEKNLDGVSLLQVINDPSSGKERVLIDGRVVRTAQYSFNLNSKALYDLIADPSEETNIREQKPELADRLRTFGENTLSSVRHPALRTTPPDFPFFFAVNHFQATPEEIIKESKEISDESELATITQPWLFIRVADPGRTALIRLPQETSPPITLVTAIPNGSYEVSLMLETKETVSFNPEELGLEVRFSPHLPFIHPKSIEFFGNAPGGGTRHYVTLGKALVNEETFSLEIAFPEAPAQDFIIRHIKFRPEKVAEGTVQRYSQDIIDSLKLIGYLNSED